MAKKLNTWLDEFVKNGADPKNVTEWPEKGGGSADLGLQFQSTKDVAGFFYTDLYNVAFNDATVTDAYLNSAKLKQILIDANVDLDKVLDDSSYIDLYFTVPWSDSVNQEGLDSIPTTSYKNFTIRLRYDDDEYAGKIIYVANIEINNEEHMVGTPIHVSDFEGTTWGDLFDYLIENTSSYFQILLRTATSQLVYIGERIVGGITNFNIDPTIPAFSTVCYVDWDATDIYFADANYIDINDLKDAIEFHRTNE